MKLEWQRPGVVRVTAKVEELALLVAAGRIAAAALENQPGEQAAALGRVLRNLDRGIEGLRSQGSPDGGDQYANRDSPTSPTRSAGDGHVVP